ncbi:MAG: hypothetical protein C0601_13065 [Candidatus Muiribacterium halophilum]|uniref:4Fe4S-binding SPASM domain-containing protein n=1 Tax=Muiribacterium halophilum TaxID=2053465 RepID=A0A2N5Z9T2_MUIH1|nr:MAG: hypothetical protein C0601_13065 [Candidatus Muirbacterium halophilum]
MSDEFILKKQGGPIPVLILDLISYCNYSCIMCPQSKINENETFRGVMDFKLYKSIIDELCTPPQKARVIIPFWNGEPTLYPKFKEALEYAAKKKKEFPQAWEVWSLHTNFSLIDEDLARTIIRSELFGPITVSLDAIKTDSYSKIRVGGKRDEVYENIKRFIKIRQELGKEFPSLTIQFIVQDQNIDEVEEFVAFWKDEFSKYGIEPKMIKDEAEGMEKDTIYIRRLIANTGKEQPMYDDLHKKALIKVGLINEMTDEQIVKHAEYIEEEENVNTDLKQDNTNKPEKKRREPCVGLWQHFGIRFDGETSACCIDFRCEQSLGNIKDKGFFAIWNSKKLMDYRFYHLKGDFKNIKICSTCRNQPFGALNYELLDLWLESVGKKDDFDI